MTGKTIFPVAMATLIGVGGMTAVMPASANMFDFMNPGRWFDDDDDYRRHRYGPYGYSPYGYGPYGYGGGPYGYGGGPYGWGGGPYGWGGGRPYGWGQPYGAGSTIVVTPQASGSADKKETPPPKLPE